MKNTLVPGLTLALFLGLLPSASAAITFSLSPSSLAIAPGGSVIFAGTIANSLGASEVFLNQLSFSFPLASQGILTADPTLFFTNAPLSLLSNESYTGDLFTIDIHSMALDGTYFGETILIGGLDNVATDTLGSAQFSVIQTSGTSAPEPGSLGLLALGALGGVRILRRRTSR